MSGELVQVQERPLAVVPKYSTEQIKLLAETIARGCTESEMNLFLEIAKLTRLNPFTGQIRPVKRWNSDLGREAMVIQTGIDGYRSIASRTGEMAGIEDPIYDSEEEAFPKWAKVTVYRWSNGEKIPYTATARWTEYVQKKKDGHPNSMWTRMPYLMLGKCAESLALRKAFPDELSSVYTEEEMGQADNPEPEGQQPQGKAPVKQPTRASEKRTEEAKQEEKVGEAKRDIAGTIQDCKAANDGSLWLHIDGLLIYVKHDKVVPEMGKGNYLSVHAGLLEAKSVGKYWATLEVKECQVVQEAEPEPQDDGEPPEENKDAEPLEASAPPKGLENLFEGEQVKTGKDLGTGTMSKKEQAWRAHIGHDPAQHITWKQGNLLFSIQSGRQLSDETVKGVLIEEFGIPGGHRYLVPKDIFPEVLDILDPDFQYHEKK